MVNECTKFHFLRTNHNQVRATNKFLLPEAVVVYKLL